jgi:hypothetical protein
MPLTAFLTALYFIYWIMVFVTLGVGIMPALNYTTISKSESSTQDSDRHHEILTQFLAQMLVAEANVLEKALSAGLNPLSQWHCTTRWSIHGFLVAGMFVYAAFSEVFKPFLGTWVACISYLHLLVQMHFTQVPK